jgi:hypothetical protein
MLRVRMLRKLVQALLGLLALVLLTPGAYG